MALTKAVAPPPVTLDGDSQGLSQALPTEHAENRILVDYAKYPRQHPFFPSTAIDWPRKLDNRTALISAQWGCTSLNLPPFEIWNKKPSSEIWKVSSNAELAGRSSSTNHTDDPMVNFFIKIPKDLGKSTEKVHKLREFFNQEERESNRLQSHSLAKTLTRSRSMPSNQAGSASNLNHERAANGKGLGTL